MRKYVFSWDLIGNVGEGRPNLGDTVGVSVYRLMQYTLRDVLEQTCGTEKADEIFYEAGKKAGAEFYGKMIGPVDSLSQFASKLQQVLREQRIGLLRMEEVRLDEGVVFLTIDEDLDCSGLPQLDYEVCVYDEGFVAALLECFTGQTWRAKEIDCWCTGSRTCRFRAVRTPA
ncbi:MAG TPA: 4-vinyl reductase [Clostridia bacterium]|nr:4-vinyl reductase [Clostridia bacterium]